jgi:hypothetical protein
MATVGLYSVTGCGVSMRYMAIVGVMIGVLAAPAQARTMPPPFEDVAQIYEKATSIRPRL